MTFQESIAYGEGYLAAKKNADERKWAFQEALKRDPFAPMEALNKSAEQIFSFVTSASLGTIQSQ